MAQKGNILEQGNAVQRQCVCVCVKIVGVELNGAFELGEKLR
jgi:hypothetical protein